MFRTDDNDLAGVPGVFGEGLAHWHAVSRMLRKHWFHLTVKMIVKGRAQEFELMVNDEPKLQQVLQSQDDEVFVKEIQIVTPANMNGGDACLDVALWVCAPCAFHLLASVFRFLCVGMLDGGRRSQCCVC